MGLVVRLGETVVEREREREREKMYVCVCVHEKWLLRSYRV